MGEQRELDQHEKTIAASRRHHLETKQKVLSGLTPPRELDPHETQVLADARKTLARPVPGMAPPPRRHDIAGHQPSPHAPEARPLAPHHSLPGGANGASPDAPGSYHEIPPTGSSPDGTPQDQVPAPVTPDGQESADAAEAPPPASRAGPPALGKQLNNPGTPNHDAPTASANASGAGSAPPGGPASQPGTGQSGSQSAASANAGGSGSRRTNGHEPPQGGPPPADHGSRDWSEQDPSNVVQEITSNSHERVPQPVGVNSSGGGANKAGAGDTAKTSNADGDSPHSGTADKSKGAEPRAPKRPIEVLSEEDQALVRKCDEVAVRNARGPGKPRVTSVAFDRATGRYYDDRSRGGRKGRQPTKIDPRLQAAVDKLLLKIYPKTSWYDYQITNCAEFNAVNNALLDGVKPEDIVIRTVETRPGWDKTPCKNCLDWLDTLKIKVINGDYEY